MTIQLLGTGGADGIPGLYSHDRVSNFARKHRGREIRTRSAALVDGSIKIDLGPDSFCQIQGNELDPLDWSALVFTHSHEDHFLPSEVQYALYPFTELQQLPFQIYGNEVIGRSISLRYPDWPIDFIEFKAFETITHGKYRITPVPAHHVPEESCFNLVFQHDKTLVYATDTGWWDEPTFQYLENLKIDCLVIECTDGFSESDYDGHLNLRLLEKVLERLRKAGALSQGSLVKTTHHSHSGNGTYDELNEALFKFGASPGFDGEKVIF